MSSCLENSQTQTLVHWVAETTPTPPHHLSDAGPHPPPHPLCMAPLNSWNCSPVPASGLLPGCSLALECPSYHQISAICPRPALPSQAPGAFPSLSQSALQTPGWSCLLICSPPATLPQITVPLRARTWPSSRLQPQRRQANQKCSASSVSGVWSCCNCEAEGFRGWRMPHHCRQNVVTMKAVPVESIRFSVA